MSDRRTYKERNAAMLALQSDLNVLEKASWFDLVENATRLFERYEFGEAWKVTWLPGDPVVVLFTVENTETPQFVLARMRNRQPGLGDEPDHLWFAYTWLPEAVSEIHV